MNKIEKILDKSFEIKTFETFNVETEWAVFMSNNVIVKDDVKDYPKDNKSNIRVLQFISRIAAVFFILGIVLPIFKKEKPLIETLSTSVDSKQVELIDGSKINLDKHSEISYFVSLENKNIRSVNLIKGNAQFDITKSIIPFKIDIDDLSIEVIGTRFKISNQNDGIIEIILEEGKLKAKEKKNPNNFVLLNSGDTFFYQNGIFVNPNEKTEEKEIVIKSKPQNQITHNNKEENLPKIDLPNEEVKKKRFSLESVIKNHLLKYYKNQVKIGKKVKLDYDSVVEIDNINKDPELILKDLKNRGIIDYTEGECENCFIILSPNK